MKNGSQKNSPNQQTDQQQKTVIIADDHPIFRKGLREMIEEHPAYAVIAEAESGVTAWQHYQSYQPDITVLDISMGEVNGLEVAEKILAHNKRAICIIMTMYSESVFCQRALSLGVKGYLLKDDVSDAIISCLDAVVAGKTFISDSLGDISQYCTKHSELADVQPESVLSEKELIILQAIAELKTNKEVAKEHDISHRTVQNHRQNISSKLNLTGRQALLQFAIKWLEQKRI